MKNATKQDCLPPMIANLLNDSVTKIDSLFADTWKLLRFNSLISKAGFRKRSGTDIVDVVFLLLLWKWINVSSICMFFNKSMGLFSHASKDVLYDTLKREDINWREFNLQVAQGVYAEHALDRSRVRAFVLDDSINQRRGKNLEGVSSHFDHVTNTHVMGQWVSRPEESHLQSLAEPGVSLSGKRSSESVIAFSAPGQYGVVTLTAFVSAVVRPRARSQVRRFDAYLQAFRPAHE